MIKIQAYQRKEKVMEKVISVIKFVVSCVFAPVVIVLLILSYAVAICNSWVREAVFIMSPDVGAMMDDAIYWIEDKTLEITGAFYR